MLKEPPSSSSHPRDGIEPLHSDFRADGGMREIIVLFLIEIPDRIHSLTVLREQGECTEFSRLLHQIKGAGGGYGYPQISQAAVQLSRCLEASGDAWMDACDTHFQALLNLLRRAHAGLPDLQE